MSFEPTDVDGLLHWYRSDEVTLSSGSFVQWNDLVGATDGIQTSANHRPIVDVGPNGHSAIEFSPNTTQNQITDLDALVFSCSLIPRPWSVALIWRLNDAPFGTFDGSGNDAKAYVLASHQPNQSTSFQLTAVGSGQHVTGSTIIMSGSSMSSTVDLNNSTSGSTYGTTIITSDSSATTLYNNNVIIMSSSLPNVPLNYLVLGADDTDAYRGGARMSVLEMMVFTGSLSSSSIAALTNYANTRYTL